MKRFLLFAGQEYYPGGGWNDFVADFHDADEARAHIAEMCAHQPTFTWPRWWQLVDTARGGLIDEDWPVPKPSAEGETIP